MASLKPVLDIASLGDSNVVLKIAFAELVTSLSTEKVVSVNALGADNEIGIKRFPLINILETDFSPADNKLTDFTQGKTVEFPILKLVNGVKHGFRIEVMTRPANDPAGPITFYRSVERHATPVSLPSVPQIIAIAALSSTSFKVTLANPFANDANAIKASPIAKLVLYLSVQEDNTTEARDIINNVVSREFSMEGLLAKDSDGLYPSTIDVIVDGIDNGQLYEFSSHFANHTGLSPGSISQKLVGGSTLFEKLENVEAIGSDKTVTFRFERVRNFAISKLLGVVVENVVNSGNALAPMYYLYKGNGVFNKVEKKDDLVGPGFEFVKSPKKHSLDVDGLSNNINYSFNLRPISPYGEGADLSEPKVVRAQAPPSELRDCRLNEHFPSDATFLSAYKAKLAILDRRFVRIRSLSGECREPLNNWVMTGGTFRTVQTAVDSKDAAFEAAVERFLSPVLPLVPAANGLPALDAIDERSAAEMLLSVPQVRNLIADKISKTTPTGWANMVDKLTFADNMPRLVTALDLHFGVLSLAKSLQDEANGALGYIEVEDNYTDASKLFNTSDVRNIFAIAGSKMTVTFIARIVTGNTVLESTPKTVEQIISGKPSDAILRAIAEAGNRDITLKLREFGGIQGLDMKDGLAVTLLLKDGNNVLSSQSKILPYILSSSGIPQRKDYSLADAGFNILNGSLYDLTVGHSGPLTDTVTKTVGTIPATTIIGLTAQGKSAGPIATIVQNSNGGVELTLKELSDLLLDGAVFDYFEFNLVPKALAPNSDLKALTQTQLGTFFSSSSNTGKFVALKYSVNKNNATSGIIQTELERKAGQTYTSLYAEFTQGTEFTAVYRTTAQNVSASSDWLVGPQQQTFTSPDAPAAPAATANGRLAEIAVQWSNPAKDGKGGSIGENILYYEVQLFNASAPSTVLYTETTDKRSYVFGRDGSGQTLEETKIYFARVMAFSKDKNGENQPLKSVWSANSNPVALYTTPIITKAVVTGNNVNVEWDSKGTSAGSLFHFFSVVDEAGNIVPEDFIGTVNLTAGQTAAVLRFTPTNSKNTLVPEGLVLLNTLNGSIAYKELYN